MRIAFIGCVEFSYSALERALTLPSVEVAGVVTRRQSAFNSDFCSLEPLAAGRGIPLFFAEGNEQSELARWLEDLKPRAVYCFGWPYLLKSEVLRVPPLGVVGYHPAALPRNRGRHPIIWTLALGLPETASTFFFMDEGADSGDILSQRPVKVSEQDDAASLYGKLTATAMEQIAEFSPRLADGAFQRVPQDHSRANSWRKRGRGDGQIDWRMSARSIHNLVRALARPYPGAHCLRDGREVKVWKTALADGDWAHMEPGKVLEVRGSEIVVRCGEGTLRLVEHGFEPLPEPGSYL